MLVTGVTGLLGRQVVEDLVQYCNVHAVVRAYPTDAKHGVRYHALDLGDAWDPAGLPSAVDAVIHLAQSRLFRRFPDQAIDVFRVNVDSTARLLDYAVRAGASQFILASSGGVYRPGGDPFNETDGYAAPSQLGYYLATKVSGEVLAQSYSALLKIITLRFFFIYGRGQHRMMLLPRLVDSVLAGRPIDIQGSNGMRFNPIHVEDASRAVRGALELGESGVFNVAGSEVFSLRELGHEIALVAGRDAVFRLIDGAPADFVANIKMMSQRLCVPTVSLRVGLRDLLL